MYSSEESNLFSHRDLMHAEFSDQAHYFSILSSFRFVIRLEEAVYRGAFSNCPILSKAPRSLILFVESWVLL
jgi:hypothetical protein